MEKCQKCKKKIALIHCISCKSFFCLECDRLTHNISKNKKHKRTNITSSLLNLGNEKKNISIHSLDTKNIKNGNNKENEIGYITQYNFNKIKTQEFSKEDPNIHLVNKLKYNLDNNYNIENENMFYKNDFNKLYKYIKITNIKNKIDINNLLNIIEQQDIIINDLFKKIYYLKQNIIENISLGKDKLRNNEINYNCIKNEKYFEKKLDIINKIYEKQEQELIKEQEEKILKIKKDYEEIKEKYISIIKGKENKFKNKGEINNIINKLLLDKKNLNLNNNQLSKINKEFYVVELLMNEHIEELIDKIKNIFKKESNGVNKIRFKSYNENFKKKNIKNKQ